LIRKPQHAPPDRGKEVVLLPVQHLALDRAMGWAIHLDADPQLLMADIQLVASRVATAARHPCSDHHFHWPAQGICQSLLLPGGPTAIAAAYQWLMLVAPQRCAHLLPAPLTLHRVVFPHALRCVLSIGSRHHHGSLLAQ
jgi:hypothetical protein